MDILGKRKIWYTVSSILIILSLIFLIFQGLNYGIDFTGGTELEFEFETEVNNQDVTNVLLEEGYEGFVVQQIDQDGEEGFLVRMQDLSVEDIQGIEGAFKAEYPTFQLLRDETVGPKMGRELLLRALLALLLASIAIIIYVSIRFEFRFAIVSIIALIHDILITVGIFAILGQEVNQPFVAALLTILGYSINDTIVIFDRIRENMKMNKKRPFAELANEAVVDTLPRTINTSMTTLVVILAIYLFGGIELKPFMLALFIGMAAGTYSSIFVASPLLLSWQNKFSSAKR